MTRVFENFYTLPSLDEDPTGQVSIRWLTDLNLQRNFPRLIAQIGQSNESNLIRHLLQQLGEQPVHQLTLKHLFAYTARFASFSVYRIKAELAALNRMSDPHVLFKDLFQISLEAIANPLEFYKNYDLERTEAKYWLPSLKAYIRRRIEGMLCDKIRTMEGLTTYKRSALGLVARSSKKQIKAALLASGFKAPQLNQYLLAWQCFQEIRKGFSEDIASIRQVRKADQSKGTPQFSSHEMFQLVAHRYNSLSSQLPLTPAADSELTEQIVEVWLNQMGAALRQYLDPPCDDLDRPYATFSEAREISVGEIVPDTRTEVEIGFLSQSELTPELQAFKAFLNLELHDLAPEIERIPLMLHGMTMVQSEIGLELDKNQSTVGRQYKRMVHNLLERLAQWAMEQQGLSLESEMLLTLKELLQESLSDYYVELVDTYFVQNFTSQSIAEKELLRLHYLCKSDLDILGDHLNPSAVEVGDRLSRLTGQLQMDLKGDLEARIHYTFKPNGPALAKLASLIESLLLKAPYPQPNNRQERDR